MDKSCFCQNLKIPFCQKLFLSKVVFDLPGRLKIRGSRCARCNSDSSHGNATGYETEDGAQITGGVTSRLGPIYFDYLHLF